jgi:hypothetical protein
MLKAQKTFPFTPFGKVRFSLQRFSRKLQLLEHIKWRSPLQNFAQIGQELLNVRVQSPLTTLRQVYRHCP